MAFKKRDVKKSSYYVWFLGAKESSGLRGDDIIIPVLHDLLDQEREFEPSKVTLQVSSKGLKIIQNVPKKSKSSNYASNDRGSSSTLSISSGQQIHAKMEQIKHTIPSTAITCVAQEDDIVCIILLLYNPITQCPIHVHGYRCDSVETASALKGQLQVLIDRPENHKKFEEVEKRLAFNSHQATLAAHFAQKSSSSQLQPQIQSSGKQFSHIRHHVDHEVVSCPNQRRSNSDGRSTRTESDGTDDSFDSFNGHYSPPSHVPSSPLSPQLVHHTSSSSSSVPHRRLPLFRRNSSSCPPALAKQQQTQQTTQQTVHSKFNKKKPQLTVPCDYDDYDLPKAAMFESLAHELKVKLGNAKSVGPILLPPKDYDTISRTRGNLVDIEKRKSTNRFIVGSLAEEIHHNSKLPAGATSPSRDLTQHKSDQCLKGIQDRNKNKVLQWYYFGQDQST